MEISKQISRNIFRFQRKFSNFLFLSLLGILTGAFFYFQVNGLLLDDAHLGSWILSPFLSYLVSFTDKKENYFLKEINQNKKMEVSYLEKKKVFIIRGLEPMIGFSM